jgi:hypothetical protein
MFGLGDNTNKRSTEPSEVRAYPTTEDGTVDRSKLPVWIGSKAHPEYKLKENEVAVYHGALDITSRGPDGKPVAREFTAGVYGTVLASREGFIAVQMADGNIVQYLHASEARLQPGQAVKPDTILGATGNLGTNGKPLGTMAIHLHIQVTNYKGKLLDPDRAILAGRAEKQDRTIKWVKPAWVNVGPLRIDNKKPKVSADGVVNAAANQRLYFDESAKKNALQNLVSRLDEWKKSKGELDKLRAALLKERRQLDREHASLQGASNAEKAAYNERVRAHNLRVEAYEKQAAQLQDDRSNLLEDFRKFNAK